MQALIPRIKLFLKGLLNSYSQIFFSDNLIYGIILLCISFFDLVAGLSGLFSVLIAHLLSYIMGFDRSRIHRGVYGFNSLLVGLGIGIQFEPGILLFIIVFFASVFTILITISLQGIIGKYSLPYLSLPFLLSFWIMLIATNELTVLGISERGIYTFNDLYTVGGQKLVNLYEWWQNIELPQSLRVYFISLGAILFQFNVFAGVIISLGILIASRISFTLSLAGFYTAYLFYQAMGADITELTYSYIGFNYILTSIAIGGFFIIPSWRSYLWVIILMPVVALVTIAFGNIFAVFDLPIYSLPFNIVVIIFLYALKFRLQPNQGLSEVHIQENTPEKNLYSYLNSRSRFGLQSGENFILPFLGKWTVSQGHNGEHTHKEEWKEAWDFIVVDDQGNQFKGNGGKLEDYYCYGKAVVAPADGWVETTINNIPDNTVGEINVHQNWGNSVIIRHSGYIYSAVSHLQPESLTVKPGIMVKKGEIIGKCGNSGRSPYPHLHFQLQASSLVGAPTIDHPLSYYLKHQNDKIELVTFDKPEVNEVLSNIEQSEILKEGLDFLGYKSLSFRTEDRTVRWETKIDPYNNTFLECLDTGAKAYYTYDNYMLYFKYFTGSRKSLLYLFFLGFYKIQTGFYRGITISDVVTPNYIFKKPFMILQDFFAPFFLFISAEYVLEYTEQDNDIDPTRIELRSEIIFKSPFRRYTGLKFVILFGEKGLDRFKAIQKGNITEAICITDTSS